MEENKEPCHLGFLISCFSAVCVCVCPLALHLNDHRAVLFTVASVVAKRPVWVSPFSYSRKEVTADTHCHLTNAMTPQLETIVSGQYLK